MNNNSFVYCLSIIKDFLLPTQTSLMTVNIQT